MKRILLLSFILSVFTSWISAGQVEFRANAPRQVLVNDKFQIVYTLNTEGSDITMPAMTDFAILMGPSTSQSSSIQIINGQMSRSVQFGFTYILKASKEGTFTIPPATVVVNGNTIQSNSVQIQVLKNQGASQSSAAGGGESEIVESGSAFNDEDVIVKTYLSKSSVYQGEAVVATTKIYTRIGLDGISDVKQAENRDFLAQEIGSKDNNNWGYENINGKSYRVNTFDQRLLIPQKSGRLTVDPTELEFLVRQRVTRQSNSIFDDFFDGGTRTVKKRVKSAPISINVKPLPSGAPSSFSGITGELNIDASVSKTDAKTNDGITYKITLNGSGNHKFADAPKIKFPADFESYEPKVTTNIVNSAAGMKGTKVFEYLLIPRHAGNFTIPSVEFSYFNPQNGQYKTITAPGIPINVEKGVGDDTQSVTANRITSKEDLKFIGQDIRFIKQTTSPLKSGNSFLLGSFTFVFSYLVALLLLVGAYIYLKKRAHESENVHLVKKSKANKVAVKRLKTAAHFLQTKEKEKFYDEVLKALWGYLGDKLNLPLSTLSKDNASAILLQHGASQELVNSFMTILDTCEFARYAPGSGSEEMDRLYADTLETIGQIESKVK
ncbi:MAG: protein BatD [Breznakibacter sp.]|nr:protein BatD [Breznakibacter sp.]